MTCQQKRAWADAQRQTWVRDIVERGYADVKFFIGTPRAYVPWYDDEVLLDCPDDYRGIPLKVKAICEYVVEHEYDYVAKCDDDVYVVPERFKTLPYAPADYVGRFRSPYGNVYPSWFASGFFYWLSLRAATIVAETPWNGDWMDERFVATALACHGITGYADDINYMATGPHLPAPTILNINAFKKGTVFCEYGPRDIVAMHLAMRLCTPVRHTLLELKRQPEVNVNAEILSSKPNDDVPSHKRARKYVAN